ncbi:MAG: hypothetical protein AAFV80_03340 [Bacteroidota bacterium]
MKELLTQRTINILVGVFVVINIGLLGTLWLNKQNPSPAFDESFSYRPLEELLRIDFGFSEAEIQTFRSNRKILRQQVDQKHQKIHELHVQLLERTARGTYESAETKNMIRTLSDTQAAINLHIFEFLESVRKQVQDAPEADRLNLFREIGRSLEHPGPPPPHR